MSAIRHHNALASGYRLHWYRIESVLGQGGFGITYLATDTNLDQPVAIKEFLPSDLAVRTQDSAVHPVSDARQDTFGWGLNRFLTEARTLAQFRHPNIVRVYSVFEANGTAYMVMEYERGTSLEDALKFRYLEGERALVSLVHALMDGLELVHQAGFIHRDIKPDNIFMRENDGVPVLLDFGSARQAVGVETKTLTSLVTPGYAPFEQYNATRENDRQGPWTDIYSLAATLYRGITGRGPIDAVARADALLSGNSDPLIPLAQLAPPGYSPRLLEAVDAGLRFQPGDRPQSLAEWRTELPARPTSPDFTAAARTLRAMEALGQDEATVVRGDAPSGRAAAPRPTPPATDTGRGGDTAAPGRRRGILAVLVVAVLAAGALGAWWMLRGPGAPGVARAPVPSVGSHEEQASAGSSPAAAPAPAVSGSAAGASREPPPGPAQVTPPQPVASSQTGAAAGLAALRERLQRERKALEDERARLALDAERRAAEDARREAQSQAQQMAAERERLEKERHRLESLRAAQEERAAAAAAGGAAATGTAAAAAAGAASAPQPPAQAAEEPRPQAPVRAETQPQPEPQQAQSQVQAPPASRAAAGTVAPPPPPAASDEAKAREEKVASLLASAEEDVAALRLTSPPERNALERYRAVLALDPGNATARAGLGHIVDRYLALAADAAGAGEFDRGLEMLDRARRVDPGSAAVEQARSRIEERAAQARRAEEDAARQAAQRERLQQERLRLEAEREAAARQAEAEVQARREAEARKRAAAEAAARAEAEARARAEEAARRSVRLAVFPHDSIRVCFYTVGNRLHEAAKQAAGRSRNVTLAYSYYVRNADASQVGTGGRLWQGTAVRKTPDVAAVQAAARAMGVDAVLMAWYHCHSSQGVDEDAYRVQVFLVDVRTGTVYEAERGLLDTGQAVDEVLGKLYASRGL